MDREESEILLIIISISSSGEARETCFPFQRISVLLQRFNAVLLHDCLPALDCAHWISYLFVSFSFFSQTPQEYTYRGLKNINNNNNKLCGRLPQHAPLLVDLWPFDLESGVWVTRDVAYLCANFSLPRPLCSRLRPDVRDRQTSDSDVRRASSLNASALWGRGIIIITIRVVKETTGPTSLALNFSSETSPKVHGNFKAHGALIGLRSTPFAPTFYWVFV